MLLLYVPKKGIYIQGTRLYFWVQIQASMPEYSSVCRKYHTFCINRPPFPPLSTLNRTSSPQESLPYMAKEYGFSYELVQYQWPRWLQRQKDRQRTIWGYKILFLDVLFPLHVKKIIFVDADQVRECSNLNYCLEDLGACRGRWCRVRVLISASNSIKIQSKGR